MLVHIQQSMFTLSPLVFTNYPHSSPTSKYHAALHFIHRHQTILFTSREKPIVTRRGNEFLNFSQSILSWAIILPEHPLPTDK